MTSFLVPGRFNGPPSSGNGGWVSGRVATHVPDASAVSVRLSAPPPLDRELALVATPGGGCEVRDGETLVATGAPGALDDDVRGPVSVADAEAAQAAYEGLEHHPFPTCYACGTARTDGLGLRPGPVAGGDGTYACTWTPTEVDVESVWAALDCPGGWATGIAGRLMVLGTMAATVMALPIAGHPHVVVAWHRGSQGRTHRSGSALYAADGGRLLARAEATWVAVDAGRLG